MNDDFQIKLSGFFDAKQVQNQLSTQLKNVTFKINVELSQESLNRIKSQISSLNTRVGSGKVVKGVGSSSVVPTVSLSTSVDSGKTLKSLRVTDESEIGTYSYNTTQAVDGMEKLAVVTERVDEKSGEVLSTLYDFAKPIKDAEKEQQQYQRLLSSTLNSIKEAKIHENDRKELLKEVNAVEKDTTMSLKDKSNALNSAKEKTSKLSKSYGTLGQSLLSAAAKFTAWYLIAGVVTSAIGVVKDMISAVVELDNAMVELNKVFDASKSQLNDVKKQAFEMATSLGSTGTEVIKATTEFKRMGYSIEQSLDLARVATTMTNVAEGITSTTEAASVLVSILKGLNIDAKYAESILDRINEVSNNNAISFDKLATMLQRSASTMDILGNTLDETIGLLTAGYEVLQDERVAKGIQTIGLRIAGLNEDLEGTAGFANDASKALEKYAGISIWEEETGELKSTYDILQEVSEKWDEIGKKSGAQQALLNELAGKERADVASAIIKNFQAAQKAVDDAQNSMKSATKEQQTYLDSIQGGYKQIENVIQVIGDEVIGSDLIKVIVDIAEQLIRVFGAVLKVVSRIFEMSGIYKIVESIDRALEQCADILEFIIDLGDKIMNLPIIRDIKKFASEFHDFVFGFGADLNDWFWGLFKAGKSVEEVYNDVAETFEKNKKVLSEYDKALNKLKNSLSNYVIDKQNQIDLLEKENDRLKKQKEIQDKLLAVEKAREELAKAKLTRVAVFRAGRGLVYESDPSATQTAQESLTDAINELTEAKYNYALDETKNFLTELKEMLNGGEIIEGWEELFNKFGSLIGSEFDSYLSGAKEFVDNFKDLMADAGIDISSESARSLRRSALQSQIETKQTVLNNASDKEERERLQAELTSLINSYNSLVPHNASGSSSFVGGISVVGENGPELVNLPSGSEILSNSKTVKLHDIVNNPSNFLGGKGGNILQFNGNLNFPNVRNENDARAFIGEIIKIGNNAIPY